MTELWRQEMYANELYHFGIMGMKWGVRRYQNYDGSLTQAGMRRYNASRENYEKASARYKEAKKAYKDSKNSYESHTGESYEGVMAKKGARTNARLAKKQAKSRLEKDYKHLKQDKLADKGKDLYSRGKTITGNYQTTQALVTAGSLAISAVKMNASSLLGVNSKTRKKIDAALTVAGASLIAAGGVKSAVDYDRNRKLRAYYSHTSKY